MRHIILYIIFLFLVTTTYCQIDQGIWIVGGSGSFKSYHRDYHEPAFTVIYKNTDITLSPSIGYFVADKIAFGLRPSYLMQKQEDRGSTGIASGGKLNFSWLEIGAFGRWYFLKKDNNFNIVSDISYYYGLQSNFGSNTGHSSSIKALLGPVLYFNSSVGIEFLVGYNSRREFYDGSKKNSTKGFLTTIGFQIHLENDK